MEKWICKTCGTQFPASEQPPGAYPICMDERQYVGYNGQEWTTLAQMRTDGFRNVLQCLKPGFDFLCHMPAALFKEVVV